jgi:hypothetical protein
LLVCATRLNWPELTNVVVEPCVSVYWKCPAISSVIELENPDGGKLPLIVRRVNAPFGLTGD